MKRALDVAPTATSALAVYLKVIEKLGRHQEAAAVQSRLTQLRTPAAAPRHRAGLIEYLSLPPAEQRVRYLTNLRKSVAADPADFQWRIRLGRELFSDGKNVEALEVFREIKTAASDPDVLRRCGEALLEFEQYAPARQYWNRPSPRLPLSVRSGSTWPLLSSISKAPEPHLRNSTRSRSQTAVATITCCGRSSWILWARFRGCGLP